MGINSEVILLTFTDNVDLGLRTQFFECFSGQAAVSRVFKREGVPTVSYDIEMASGKRTMDITSEAGYASNPQD